FFENSKRLALNVNQEYNNENQDFEELINSVFNYLIQEIDSDLLGSLIQEMTNEEGTNGNQDSYDFFYNEIKYYNNSVDVQMLTKENVETTEVVVGSFEKILNKLPARIKKILDVAGEVLKIASLRI
ncbi:MAG: hypothetical protein VXW38_18155, partial [Bacteroidota bacterium]|nr:hypothetical protein [Bacteroidota bacterium]